METIVCLINTVWICMHGLSNVFQWLLELSCFLNWEILNARLVLGSYGKAFYSLLNSFSIYSTIFKWYFSLCNDWKMSYPTPPMEAALNCKRHTLTPIPGLTKSPKGWTEIKRKYSYFWTEKPPTVSFRINWFWDFVL